MESSPISVPYLLPLLQYIQVHPSLCLMGNLFTLPFVPISYLFTNYYLLNYALAQYLSNTIEIMVLLNKYDFLPSFFYIYTFALFTLNNSIINSYSGINITCKVVFKTLVTLVYIQQFVLRQIIYDNK